MYVNFCVCLFCLDLVPDPASFDPGSEAAQLSAQLRKLLSEAEPTTDCLLPLVESSVNQDALEMLMSAGLKIGERVVVGGAKVSGFDCLLQSALC